MIKYYKKDTIENDEDLAAAQAALKYVKGFIDDGAESDEDVIERDRLSTMIEKYVDQSHVIPEKNPHIGSTFDSFLEEEGIRDEVEAEAQEKVLQPWERQILLADNGAFLESTYLFRMYMEECFYKKEQEASLPINQYLQISDISKNSSFNVLKAFFQRNYSPAAKYHNWHHTCCMIHNVSEAYIYTQEISKKDWDLKEYRSLLLAAALHDIAHTGGHESDTVNVARAISLAADFIGYERLDTQVDRALVISLIRVTEFPFVFEPKTELEKIIRDADLLQSLEPTWFPMIYCYLFEEIKVKRPTLKFVDFCRMQHDFMHNAQFYSDWWKEKKFGEFGGLALERAVMMKERASEIINPF